MKLYVSIFLLALCAFAQTAKTNNDKPSAEQLKFDIAKTQRDLLLADAKMKQAIDQYTAAKTDAEGLQKQLTGQMATAQKGCKDSEIFDGQTLACIPKPPEAKPSK